MKGNYEVLWIKDWASMDEIKKAFRNLSMKNHPDKWWSEFLFKQINNAYQELKIAHKNWYTHSHTDNSSTNHSYTSTTTNTKQKTDTSNTGNNWKHQSIQYAIDHKVSSFIKIALLLLVSYWVLDEYSYNSLLQEWFMYSAALVFILIVYYHEHLSEKLWTNIGIWLFNYIFIIALPWLLVFTIEEWMNVDEFRFLAPIVSLVTIYLILEPLKDNKFFKKARWVVYILLFLQWMWSLIF